MALFFDRQWFDEKLKTAMMSRATMAESASVSEDELTLIFKDQMEVSDDHVRAWALLFGQTQSEIAARCGIVAPLIPRQTDAQRIRDLENRLSLLEAQVQGLIRQPNAQTD